MTPQAALRAVLAEIDRYPQVKRKGLRAVLAAHLKSTADLLREQREGRKRQ
jgi:hypothetical protein